MTRQLTPLFAGLLALTAASPGWAQSAFDGKVKVGILNDQSSIYADATGQGSVVAAALAVEDFKKLYPDSKLQVELVFADHQNKPDVGAALTRQWFERDGVDMVLDVPNSAVALAVAEIAKNLNKVHVNGAAGTTRLTGDACNANTVHWTYDNYALAHGTASAIVAAGGDSWYFLTADYAFGHDLEAQASAVVKQKGGKVLGNVRVPLNSADFSSFLMQAQASKAKVIGLANAGGDTINAIKQAAEFGVVQRGQKLAGLLVSITDVHSLGLETAQGLMYTDAYYWDANEASRVWGQRYFDKLGRKQYPGMNHAGNYSGMLHYLKAVDAAQTKDGAKVVAKMKELPSDDVLFGKGRVREDGRHVHPMYLRQVKKPAESKKPWDYVNLVATIPAEEAWRPMADGGCALVKK